MDQSLLAAPHGFSQRATSFIASWCQGIHRMPLSRSAKHTHRNHPHRDGPILRRVGRLTPPSALPVLTDQRPLRSGSRQERHATQHSEVSTHPLRNRSRTFYSVGRLTHLRFRCSRTNVRSAPVLDRNAMRLNTAKSRPIPYGTEPNLLLCRPPDAPICASGAHGPTSAPLRFSTGTPCDSTQRSLDPSLTEQSRTFYSVGCLTPPSALPVLTDQRPLRSGSRQERHATQHSEVSTHPLRNVVET